MYSDGGGPLTKSIGMPSSDDGISEGEFQTTVLRGIRKVVDKSTILENDVRLLKENANKTATKLEMFSRTRQAVSSGVLSSRGVPGLVSDTCAAYLGTVALIGAVRRGLAKESQIEALVDSTMGISVRAAVTSSDIPLPTEYQGEVVELVGLYGAARQYGTLFPLGAGTVKLPKLTTDPVFTLVAASGAVSEKVPQTPFVTFTAEKFGGIVRLPSEIEDDSVIAIGQFLARYAARNIARVEDTNFFVGTGAGSGAYGSVAGLTFSTITNSKVLQMASSKTHYSDATLAYLRSLRAVPDAPVIRKGSYYLNPSMEQLLSTFNTAGDKPYNPNAQFSNVGGQPFQSMATLDGYPIRWVDVLPAYSTAANVSTVFALFGDCSYQYLGVRGGIRFDTSMEAGFTTDEILVRALERFTIGLMANGAVAGLETAAS